MSGGMDLCVCGWGFEFGQMLGWPLAGKGVWACMEFD
jgi:hypothetical protein